MLLLVLLAACSSSNSSKPELVPLGTWGGDSAGLIVSDTNFHLHIGCTFGDVSGRVAVDADGNFDVTGSYQLHAYPITVGPTFPARFVGQLHRSLLNITVTVTDTTGDSTVVHGPVVVQIGKEPELGPCPICRRPIITRMFPF
ncbi:MAG: hypothetical protein ACREL5_09190 [Gemmatimonadales bacterium]